MHRAEGEDREASPAVTVDTDKTAPAERPILVREDRSFVTAPVYDRASLAVDDSFAGPAVVEQLDSTTIILEGWQALVVAGGHLKLTRSSE